MNASPTSPVFSLHHLTVKEVTPVELIDIAAAVDLEHVCVFVRAPSRDLDFFPLIDTEQVRRDVAGRLAATGVRVHNIEVFSLTPRTQVERFRPALEIGASLGAARATVLLNDADTERALDTFAAFCALAAEYGLQVGIEFMPFAVVNSLPTAIRFLACSGEVNASLAVDALHLRRTGSLPEDLRALTPGLIGYAQLCDGLLEKPREAWLDEAIEDRLLPGRGELPLREFLAAIPAGVVIDLEVPSRTLRNAGLGALDRARRITAAARFVAAAPD